MGWEEKSPLLFHDEKMHWGISYASGWSRLIPQIICRLRIPLCFLLSDCPRLSCLWIRTAHPTPPAQHQHAFGSQRQSSRISLCLSPASRSPGRSVAGDGQVPGWSKPCGGPTSLERAKDSAWGSSWEDVLGSRGVVQPHHTSFEVRWLMQLGENKD